MKRPRQRHNPRTDSDFGTCDKENHFLTIHHYFYRWKSFLNPILNQDNKSILEDSLLFTHSSHIYFEQNFAISFHHDNESLKGTEFIDIYLLVAVRGRA